MTRSSKLSVLAVLVCVILLTSVFTSLSTIHGKDLPEDYFISVPSILTLLNAEWFMGFVFVATVVFVIGLLLLLWRLHELPVHQAKRENQLLTKVIFGLALCGLFINKTWWVVAIILAFTPWAEIGKRLEAIFGRGSVEKDNSVQVDRSDEKEEQP